MFFVASVTPAACNNDSNCSVAMAFAFTRGSGVTEHIVKREWRVKLAFSNIGLPGNAFTGSKWYKEHCPVLVALFTNLLKGKALGLLLNEVGNMSVLTTPEGKMRLQELMVSAFEAADAVQHGPPQFFWNEGEETMAAFRAEVKVRQLESLTKMPRVHGWRVVNRFEVSAAPEHGQCSMLIYNNHQPRSDNRPFKINMQIDFCKAILRDAIDFKKKNPQCVGYGFGGDANCLLTTWNLALADVPEHRAHFTQPIPMWGRRRKGGDLMMGAGKDCNLGFENNTCAIEGREEQHDPMFMEWYYTIHAPTLFRQPISPMPPPPQPVLRRCRDQWSQINGVWKCTAQASHHNEDASPGDASEIDRDNICAFEDGIASGEFLGENSGAPEHVDEIGDDKQIPSEVVHYTENESATNALGEALGEDSGALEDTDEIHNGAAANAMLRAFVSVDMVEETQLQQALHLSLHELPSNETDDEIVDEEVPMNVSRAPNFNAKPPANDTDSEIHDDGARENDSEIQEVANEIQSIGFALVQGSAMLPGLAVHHYNATEITELSCTKSDVRGLEEITQRFLTKQPMLQTTPPRADSKAARVMKTSDEIEQGWRRILGKRRLEEPNDTHPIRDPGRRAQMYIDWMHEWMANEQTQQQRLGKPRQQSSNFAAYLNNNFGGKHFVMALWQTGVQWAPSPQMLQTDPNGALEHVAKNCAKWTQRLARSIKEHKDAPKTQEARRRSGTEKGKHGLTDLEVQKRRAKQCARKDYFWAKQLECELNASKGKGKSGAIDSKVTPKSESEMTANDWWYLNKLWSGELLAEKRRADSECHRVQADDFVFYEYSDDDSNTPSSAAMVEMRIARNGSAYDREQFVQWYDHEVDTYWNEAPAASSVDATGSTLGATEHCVWI